jgi:hypothetical protein
MSFDVFLQNFHRGEPTAPPDGDAFDLAVGRYSVGEDGWASLATLDGGTAEIDADEDGAAFFVRVMSRDVALAIFEIARDADLLIVPAADWPSAVVLDETRRGDLPVELRDDACVCTSADELLAALTGGFAAWRAYLEAVHGASEA